jgi:hypothetical protein
VASTTFGELFENVENGVVKATIPAGPYDMEVTDARVREQSALIFLTLKPLDGPSAGKEIDVSIYFPNKVKQDKQGALFYFTQKVNGFGSFPDVKAAFIAADNAPSLEQALQHIAATLIGKRVGAQIGMQENGEYAGSNELKSTKPLDASAVTAVPAATPQSAPTTVAEASTPNGAQSEAPGVSVPF